MIVTRTGDTVGLDSAATRRAVRAERASVTRWRRLLRARLDLLVATYAPPERLGEMGWDVLPQAQLAAPDTDELRAAIDNSPAEADRVGAMRRLRDLDRRLAGYATELDAALDATTEALVMRLVADELDAPMNGS
ncbi:MAG: hypothetical protein KQH57_00525 [Actinomycetales bacterium]|nr:hypothetical protein [Actinomycetales bacterium]